MALIVLGLLLALAAPSAGQTPEEATAPPAPQPFEVSEVPSEVERLGRLAREARQLSEPDAVIDLVVEQSRSLAAEIMEARPLLDGELARDVGLTGLADLEQAWLERERTVSVWSSNLEQRLGELEEARKTSIRVDILVIALATVLAAPAVADCEAFRHLEGKAWVDGDCMETPLGERWWPNPLWGAGDQSGSTNWYTKPEVVQRALAQVKLGKTLRIGQVYSADMPLFGDRGFLLRIPGGPTGGPVGQNKGVWNDEFLATEISQVGTQFDGLGHIGVQIGADGDKTQIRFYNGHTAQEILSSYGLKELGTEKLHPIVARGVLIDVAAARGVASMEAGEIISLKDVRAALAKQGMADFELQPGDAVLFRTGWEKHWITDNAKYNAGCPGIGMEVARWLAEGQVGVTGADTWPVDAVPDTDPDCVFCVHTFLQARHGIVNQENLKLSELAAGGVYQFAYFFSPVPIKGATGSIGSPVVMW